MPAERPDPRHLHSSNGPGNLTECPKGKVKRSGKCVARKSKKHKVRHERDKGKKHQHRGKK